MDLTESEIQKRVQRAREKGSSDPYLEYPPLLLSSKGKPKTDIAGE